LVYRRYFTLVGLAALLDAEHQALAQDAHGAVERFQAEGSWMEISKSMESYGVSWQAEINIKRSLFKISYPNNALR